MTDKIKSMFFVIDTPFKVALIYSNNREYAKQYDLFTFVYEPKENRVIFNFTDKE